MSVQMGLMMGFLQDGIRITVRATFLNEQSWRGVVVVVRLLVSVDYVRKGRLVSGYSKTPHRITPALFFAPIYPVHLCNTGEI